MTWSGVSVRCNAKPFPPGCLLGFRPALRRSRRAGEESGRSDDGGNDEYRGYGQPIGLDGKPGPNSVPHIPRGPDGSYPLPRGRGQ